MPRSAKAKLLSREASSQNKLPYVRHVTDRIINLENGQLLTIIELDGASFDTADESDKNDLHSKLNLLWRNIRTDQLALWTHIVRTRDNQYPDGVFRSQFAYTLDEKYKRKMAGETLYRNRLFLSLIWKPAKNNAAGSLLSLLSKATKSGSELDPKAVRDFEGIIPTVVASLERYNARQLGLYEAGGLIYSEINEVLNAIGTLDFVRFPLVKGPIGSAILIDRPLFGRETIEIRGAGSSKYAGILGLKEYPATTKPGMLNEVLKAPFECVLTQSFTMIAKGDAAGILSRRQNQMASSGDRALSQMIDLDDALDDLESNRFVMGEHHLNLMVAAESTQVLMDKMAIARRIMSDCNMITAREDLAIESAYWGQFPAIFAGRPRSGHINSRNFAALAPFHSYPTGNPESVWGPSIALLKTVSGCAFHFNLHVGDLGNTFICGPSGSGKTVLQNFLLAQLQKHDATMVFFDKDRGAEIFIRAAGGTYLNLTNGRPTGCAPLKALDLENAAQRNFAATFVRKLVSRPDTQLTVIEEREIESGIEGLRNIPVAGRTLSALRSFFSQRDPEGIGARLERWTRGNPLGWVFDNDTDDLALDGMFMGFDMTDFLDNEEIRSPLMLYLFYRVESLIDGRRIVIDIDEFWKPLADATFRELTQNKLKTIRKQNGLMIFGTQSPRDALQSSIGYTIIEQCPTKIFMPNASATVEDYVKGFGLSYREYELIKHEMTVESRQFLIKQEHNSVVAELSLHGFDDELTILSGRTSAVNRLDEIRAQVGDDPANWMPILLNQI